MKKRTKKQTEKEVQALYSKYFDCVQVNIMALGKICRAIELLLDDENQHEKMLALVAEYREN